MFQRTATTVTAFSNTTVFAIVAGAACNAGTHDAEPTDGLGPGTAPAPACAPALGGGSRDVAEPILVQTLADRWEEGWLGSPAIADLDGDGVNEIVVARGQALLVWSASGELQWKFDATPGRIWASPVVADLVGDARLDVAFASREQVFVLDAAGQVAPGFPVTWEDELRSLAAGDLDGDGDLELVAAPARGGPTDVMHAWHGDGSPVAGFPPQASGSSGCNEQCYLAGCFDQNVALGDLDGDGRDDLVVPHDNAYASFHRSDGEAFDAAAGFAAPKTPGVRYLHDLELAQQGWADDEATALQAHFTNTAPTLADIDGDGTIEIIMLGSVQNAAQTQRELGVALWVVGRDAARHASFVEPLHQAEYLSGLWDYGDNIVAITNQVAVADLDPERAGLEMVFAGFDGRIHAATADGNALWSMRYTEDRGVATGGVVIGDLSGDGAPEVVFATYSTMADGGALFVLDGGGNTLHELPLPRRGAMPVPTLADVDSNGTVDIVVSLKDAEDRVASVLVYEVPGSANNCLPWPTGRGNLRRNGWFVRE